MVERTARTQLSVIIPVGDRCAPLEQLHREYATELAALRMTHEIIYVLDGPQRVPATDVERLLAGSASNVTVVTLSRAFGESTALMAGFERAAGDLILMLPAYHQISPADIPKLLAALDSADMAVARRWPRTGGLLERVRRSAFHRFVTWVTGMRLDDIGCGARALRRRVLEEVSLYGDQHRLLPVLARRNGFRVVQVDVRQSAHDRFDGVYRPREYLHRLLDVATVFFLVRFTKKPLRFFGMFGAALFGFGTLLILYLVFDRVFLGESLADRPALLLSALALVLGLQLFALGLLAELIIFTHARQLKDYRTADIIQYPAAAERAQVDGAA